MLEVPTLGSAYPPHMPPMLCCRACSPRADLEAVVEERSAVLEVPDLA